jgi:hypothetical protein
MSQRDEKIAFYQEESKNLGLNLPDSLIEQITIDLGPSIFNPDAEVVACSQASELETIKNNFLKKKLEVDASDDELDAAIQNVCEKMGSSNKKKYRALFYALLFKHFKK